ALALALVAGARWRASGRLGDALRVVLLPAALGVATTLLWLGFRLYYYADLLPNTFYLKHAPDPAQGWRYFVNAFHSYRVGLLLLIAALALWLARRARPELIGAQRLGARLGMIAVALPVALYVIWIGGDAMHFRFLAFPFALVVCATGGALGPLIAPGGRRLGPRSRCALAALVVFGLSALQQPPQRELHALRGPGDPHMVDKISDPGRHRRRPKLRQLAQEDPDLAAKRALGSAGAPFRYDKTAALDWCGTAHWRYRWRIVHSLGLTEATLARIDVPAQRPGHRYGLKRYAEELARIYNHPGATPGRGMRRAAVSGGYAPSWVARELDDLERVEKKVFNTHDLRENLELALRTPRHLRLGSRARDRRDRAGS
ncbi:MAG: hypothetical protein KC468_37840, partial [Myxococcales bacterium]|nr:hypothetical protein [Myxococcales bacterium]